ncbi:MAG TPA: response regulator [Polyangiaceae bacterium]|nr:response regulator [Polyangiaceae bacterium]
MSAYIDPSGMSLGEALRLLLIGGIAALWLRVWWGRKRSPGDRVLVVALVWCTCVLVLIAARVALARAGASPALVPFLVRLQDTGAMAPIPWLLLALAPLGRPADRPVTTGLVVATTLAALWVWFDGPVVGDVVVERTLVTGDRYYTLETGALLSLFGVIALVAWLWSVRLVLRSEERDHDLARIVTVGGGFLAAAGANDSLMDAGIVHSVPLIDVSCFAVLLLLGGTLARRARAALGGAHAEVLAQTRELERRHADLALRERQIALGALAAGLGHEINNPLNVVAVNLHRAVELLGELDRLPLVRSSLVECAEACREVARAVIDFGASRAPDDEPASSEEDEAAPGRLRILVVDDEPLVAKSLRRALRGHQVTVAHSGAEALELLRDGSYDRVLCDVMMPGLSGPDVYRALEAEGRLGSLGFVFVTGGAFSADVAEAVRSTGARVLKKPVDPGELVRLVTSRNAAGSEPRHEVPG